MTNAFPQVGAPVSTQPSLATFTADQTNPPTNFNTAANTTSFTAIAAQFTIADDVTLQLTGTLGGAATLTTPTAIQLIYAPPQSYVGYSWNLRIINNSAGAFSWTLVGGTGVTILGTATIAQATQRDFYITITSPTAVTIQNVSA